MPIRSQFACMVFAFCISFFHTINLRKRKTAAKYRKFHSVRQITFFFSRLIALCWDGFCLSAKYTKFIIIIASHLHILLRYALLCALTRSRCCIFTMWHTLHTPHRKLINPCAADESLEFHALMRCAPCANAAGQFQISIFHQMPFGSRGSRLQHSTVALSHLPVTQTNSYKLKRCRWNRIRNCGDSTRWNKMKMCQRRSL